MSDIEKTFVWIAGAMERMKAWGLAGGGPTMTAAGVAAFDELDAVWRPKEEMLALILMGRVEFAALDRNLVLRWLVEFRDHRDRMRARAESQKGGG